MPNTQEWRGFGCYVTYTGKVTNEEVTLAGEAMMADARFDDARFMISNYLAIDDVEVDPDRVLHDISLHARIALAASISNSRIKRAIVATDETVLAAAAWYIDESVRAGSPWQVAVFATVEEAEKWVGES